MVAITLQNTTPHHILNQKPQWANTSKQPRGHCPGQHEATPAAGGPQEPPNAATQKLGLLSCFCRHSEPQGWLWAFTSEISQFYHCHFPSSAFLGHSGGWQGRLDPDLCRAEPQPRQSWCSDWWQQGPLWLRDYWKGQCHHHSLLLEGCFPLQGTELLPKKPFSCSTSKRLFLCHWGSALHPDRREKLGSLCVLVMHTHKTDNLSLVSVTM